MVERVCVIQLRGLQETRGAVRDGYALPLLLVHRLDLCQGGVCGVVCRRGVKVDCDFVGILCVVEVRVEAHGCCEEEPSANKVHLGTIVPRLLNDQLLRHVPDVSQRCQDEANSHCVDQVQNHDQGGHDCNDHHVPTVHPLRQVHRLMQAWRHDSGDHHGDREPFERVKDHDDHHACKRCHWDEVEQGIGSKHADCYPKRRHSWPETALSTIEAIDRRKADHGITTHATEES
mmetsp:Transcript_75023/g.167967  ORF Transcript_75023/g.167967 Transcript_75023/m.167967 type:complete len:232 (-) Transcript_75023:475-1170(-)